MFSTIKRSSLSRQNGKLQAEKFIAPAHRTLAVTVKKAENKNVWAGIFID